jgi:chorismate mutase
VDEARVRGIRGAVTVTENSRTAIITATEQLLNLIAGENQVGSEDIVSILFSVTADLDAAFPAEAARRLGWTMTPLMCTTEIPVSGAMEKCVRVLMHAYTKKSQSEVRHVYLGEAARLRPDLHFESAEKGVDRSS